MASEPKFASDLVLAEKPATPIGTHMYNRKGINAFVGIHKRPSFSSPDGVSLRHLEFSIRSVYLCLDVE